LPEVRPVASRAKAEAFLPLPLTLGREAADWSVPLLFDARRFFDPGFNGALLDNAVQRFLAWRSGRPVDRNQAQAPLKAASTRCGNAANFLSVLVPIPVGPNTGQEAIWQRRSTRKPSRSHTGA
jgi:hypothetical protein